MGLFFELFSFDIVNHFMRFLLFIIISIFFISCEKDIDLKLDVSQPSLVVEGTIENGRPPIIILSKSLDYFSKITPALLSSSFVRNASVVVKNGNTDFRLQEDSLKTTTGNTIYFYTSNTLIGQLKQSYSLTIKESGNTYTASTTIPETTRKIDSLWWDKVLLSKDSNDSKIFIKATDKPGLGDCIRFFTSINKGPFLPGFNSVFDDAIIDGKSYTVAIDKGIDKNADFEPGNSFFKRGDTVTIKLCNIDRTTYDFWRTFEFNFQSIGNPFSGPTKILSNISGNAIGYFGGYAAQYRTVVIPK